MADRLHEMRIESRLARAPAVLRVAPGRDGDQEHPAPEPVADAPADLVTVEAGKSDVDERDLGGAGQRDVHAGGPVTGHLDAMAAELQGPAQGLAHVVVVLDD